MPKVVTWTPSTSSFGTTSFQRGWEGEREGEEEFFDAPSIPRMRYYRRSVYYDTDICVVARTESTESIHEMHNQMKIFYLSVVIIAITYAFCVLFEVFFRL